MKLRSLLLILFPLVLLFAVACSDRNEDSNEGAESPAASPTAEPSPTATPTPPRPTPAGESAFDGARAMEHIAELATEIGPRVSGTDGETAAADYIRDQFESSGYAVETWEFAFSTDPYRSATATAGDETYMAFAMTGSGIGTVTAPTAFVGLADEAGINGQDLSGKIAVADRGTLRFSQKLENVQAAGAVALLVVNDETGDFVGNLAGQADIPSVTVNGDLRVTFHTIAQDGSEMTVDVPGGSSTASVNMIARPSEDARCEIIVGGHHDTVPGAPGAHDNASGTAAVLELARAFAVGGLEEGLCFVTFGGEESGLNGSKALADELSNAGELPEVMVNIDANGIGTLVDLIGSPELTSRALEIAGDMGIAAEVTELGANYGSDHMSFEAAGVPVIFFTSNDLGNIHTPQDTYDTIDAEIVEDGGDLAYELIKDLLPKVAAG